MSYPSILRAWRIVVVPERPTLAQITLRGAMKKKRENKNKQHMPFAYFFLLYTATNRMLIGTKIYFTIQANYLWQLITVDNRQWSSIFVYKYLLITHSMMGCSSTQSYNQLSPLTTMRANFLKFVQLYVVSNSGAYRYMYPMIG